MEWGLTIVRTATNTSRQKSCLKRHNLTHSKERPCHIRTHGSDRNFKCDICGIAFALKSRLVKHELIHRGEKPYECETGQDGRRYVCSIYGKGFKQVTTNWIISRFTLEWGPTSVSTVSKDSWQTDMCLPTQKSTRVNVKFVENPFHIDTGYQAMCYSLRCIL